MKEEKFFCKRECLTIRGMQYIPEGYQDGKLPGIILSHGFTGNYKDMEGYCREFMREGYAAFCFSFCGGGRTDGDAGIQSDGDTRDMNISTEVMDLMTVIKYVKSLDFIDPDRIVLMGFSQGGFVSGLAAARCGSEIEKLIMIFPALCIPDHARRGCLGGGDYDVHNVPEDIHCSVTVIGKNFHEDVCEMDPYLELSPYKGPVLIIHGLEDDVVNYSYSIRAKENYEEGQCRLQLVREMGHGTDDEQMTAVIASARQFLNDKKELMAIRVIITRTETEDAGELHKVNVYFTGYCESRIFKGTIIPEGVDKQTYKNGQRIGIRAEYTLEGLDEAKERCSLRIVNQWGTKDWHPVITTDSKRLSWLNDAELTAVLEGSSEGPTVRIFS